MAVSGDARPSSGWENEGNSHRQWCSGGWGQWCRGGALTQDGGKAAWEDVRKIFTSAIFHKDPTIFPGFINEHCFWTIWDKMHVHHCNICAAAASCIIGSIVWVIMYYREPLCSLSCLNETPNGQRLFRKAKSWWEGTQNSQRTGLTLHIVLNPNTWGTNSVKAPWNLWGLESVRLSTHMTLKCVITTSLTDLVIKSTF